MDTPEGWQINEAGELARSWSCANFDQAFALGTQIALLAAAHDHHPELHIRWGGLDCTLISHDVGKLTKRDERLALAINGALGRQANS